MNANKDSPRHFFVLLIEYDDERFANRAPYRQVFHWMFLGRKDGRIIGTGELIPASVTQVNNVDRFIMAATGLNLAAYRRLP